MNITKNFIKIWNINLYNKLNHTKVIENFIPIEWQVLLISDGSLTHNISIITEDLISLKFIKEEKSLYNSAKVNDTSSIWNNCNRIVNRDIWLINKIKRKILFAKSYYTTEILPVDLINKTQPLGRSLIESEIEIYRTIDSIYYGYSQILEKEFKVKGPLWGRSYQIRYLNKIIIVINEFFSPIIIN